MGSKYEMEQWDKGKLGWLKRIARAHSKGFNLFYFQEKKNSQNNHPYFSKREASP